MNEIGKPSKKKKSTGRKCSICNNERVKEINSLTVKGVSFRAISRQFFGSDEQRCSIARHSENCLNLDSAVLQERIKTKQAIDHHAELNALFENVSKHRKAAEKWLTDPNNSDEFTLAPRGIEMDVVYEVMDKDGILYHVKKPLQEIIDQISEKKPEWKVKTIFVKSVDLRDYALKTIDKADMILDKFAKMQGLYKKEGENADTLTKVAEEIILYLQEHPDYDRDKVVEIWAKKANLDVKQVSDLVN